jgi:hypothetical protein
MNVAKLSAPCTGRPSHPGNIPGTHFYQRLSLPQCHSATGRINLMKNPKDPIGNQTRDLLAGSATECPEVKKRGALPLAARNAVMVRTGTNFVCTFTEDNRTVTATPLCDWSCVSLWERQIPPQFQLTNICLLSMCMQPASDPTT